METKYTVLHPYIDTAACKVIYDDGMLSLDGLDRDGMVVVHIQFGSLLLFRLADEGLRLKLFGELSGTRGVLLYQKDSDLLSWAANESMHTKDPNDFRHFIVLLGEEVIDVISSVAPGVSIK